jgi:hypothetical protein
MEFFLIFLNFWLIWSKKTKSLYFYRGGEHYATSPKQHGLDMDKVRETLLKLAQAPNIAAIQKVSVDDHI